jgi:outer membrane protein assembly factor BamB
VTSDGPSAQGLHLAWTSSVLDGDMYAQPLVVGGVVIVATENNSVFAFDAVTGALRWQQLKLGVAVTASSLPCGNVDPVGITSTPVADIAGNRLYVVGMVQPAHHELFALALDTGAVVLHRTIDAAGSDPSAQNQRGALALANGKVYVPFGGRFGDCGNYKGRLVAVSADGSGSQSEYAVRADRQGGFWAPPGPAVANDGTLFMASGNSDGQDTFDDGNAVIHLTGDLAQSDEFAPTDWATLNATDSDVGTTSPALLDNQRVVQIGKSGVGYVLDTAHLGGVGGELHQEKVCDRVMGGLAHDASTVFVPCTNEVKALTVSGAGFTEAWSASISNPGPPIVAAGLVWVLDLGSGTLHALDRQSGHEVFTATVGAVSHFSAPSAGDRTVFVAAGRKVEAFNQSAGGAVTP